MKIALLIMMCTVSYSASATECVILLHGLARSASSMDVLESRLVQAGFAVVNIDYPSRKYPIDELSEIAIPQGLKKCEEFNANKIHFVTHSLGGILLRQYLSKNSISNLGRTVMLAPPNGGSEVVDKLKAFPGFKFINGPAGLQLDTNAESVPRTLGAANFEVGIIAGTKSINVFLSMLIPSKNDGKVSVKNAHLKNETDFLELPVTHPFIMRNKKVIDNVISYLLHGKFNEIKT